MNTRDSAFAYQQSSASSASAVGQVVALYDRILRDLRQGILALEAGQVERRVYALNHALTIIAELQGVLDFERGGAPARNLNSFYNVARSMLTQAGVGCSVETLQELISMFTRMRAAWAKIETTVAPAEPTQRLRISNRMQGPLTQETRVISDAAPSADGGWRA
ncbi:MAG TPA: flagellar export chaperone FliS [Terriglobales bacterium]|nr:flagellar export chaperone FliS [Terriglobales bacterium]